MSKKVVKVQACPMCGALMRYERHPEVLEYRGRTKKVNTLGFWCTGCGEGILAGRPLAARERALLSLKAEVENQFGPEQVTAIRKKLELDERTAGTLLGGSPIAFQQYESGEIMVGVTMAHLLRLLDRNPKLLKILMEPKLAKAQPSVERTWSDQAVQINQADSARRRKRTSASR